MLLWCQRRGSGCSRGGWTSLRGGRRGPPGRISGGPCCVWHCPRVVTVLLGLVPSLGSLLPPAKGESRGLLGALGQSPMSKYSVIEIHFSFLQYH